MLTSLGFIILFKKTSSHYDQAKIFIDDEISGNFYRARPCKSWD